MVEVGRTYYMTYTGYDGSSARLCLATSRNLTSWNKHGPIFPDFVTRDVDKPWNKSGAILTKRLGGKYCMYFGDKDIYWATRRDLIHWTPGPVDDPVCAAARHLQRGAARARPAAADHRQRLHPADPQRRAQGPRRQADLPRRPGADRPGKPNKELARLTTPFIVPETPEETGQVNNVVFVEGLVAWRGEWLLYYGQGDAGVGVLHGRA